jgi:hypothetical protein
MFITYASAVLILAYALATAECVVYSAACKAGVDWECYK